MCRASCFDSWTRLLALAHAGEDEPSSGWLSRRDFLAAAATPVLAAACARPLPPPPGPTRDLLEATLSFDLHSHPGLFRSTASDTLAGHRRSAEVGLVKVISLTATSDAPVIARSASGGLRATREPQPGELYASMWRQMDLLRTWSAGAGMPLVLHAGELGAPASAPVRGLLAVEGCDFLEGRVERVQEAFDGGIRSLQLVHYRVNELGDIQTETPVHGGLTTFGRAGVRDMNRLGIVVDVAHATLDVVRGVTETTTQPIILSHSNIQDGSGWARFITVEHARMIAGTGGVIGAMPYIRGHRGDYVTGYVDHISRLVDAVGVEHVGIGTDMDGIGPGVIFTSYDRWPSLAQALLDRGYGKEEVTKILGDNCWRVFEKVGGGVRAARPRRETVSPVSSRLRS
jgi:membrane dipeptidase